MKNREVLLSVQNLEQFFKMGRKVLKAVNDVSFDIYKGEVFGLVGESGCGKTTLVVQLFACMMLLVVQSILKVIELLLVSDSIKQQLKKKEKL